MNIIFAGTPELASFSLNELISSNHRIQMVMTQPDRPKGRGMKLQASPVKQKALEYDIPILQPITLKNHEIVAKLVSLQPDLMVVVAYGLIIPQEVLEIPKYGCINIHASLLPRWRGAAPIQRAIEAGDSETGICIMQMDEGLDTGDILLSEAIVIEHNETSETLHDKLMILGAKLCKKAVDSLSELTPEPQKEEGVVYAHKIKKEEALIQWQEPAEVIARKIRAFNPFPVAFTYYKDGLIKIWEAKSKPKNKDIIFEPGEIISINRDGLIIQTGNGELIIKELQRPGSRKLSISEFIKGCNFKEGEKLGGIT